VLDLSSFQKQKARKPFRPRAVNSEKCALISRQRTLPARNLPSGIPASCIESEADQPRRTADRSPE